MELICPICQLPLFCEGRSLRCGRNHSFDVARQGYVNLLPVQQKRSLHPGDTREQVLSRREFLESGAYSPIVEAVKAAAEGHAGPILDVGCGEGWYAVQVADHLGAELTGLDISKRPSAAPPPSIRATGGSAAPPPICPSPTIPWGC